MGISGYGDQWIWDDASMRVGKRHILEGFGVRVYRDGWNGVEDSV